VKNVVIAFNNRAAYEKYVRTGSFPESVEPRYGGELIVKVHSNEGITGLGIGGDPKRLHEEIAPRIVGEDPFDVERIHEKLGSTLYDDAGLRAPIDCALYDMMGKVLGVPVYALLGGCVRREIPVAWVIGYKTPEETAQDAVSYVGEGYRTLKLKQGFDPDMDVDRVRAVREAVGDGVNIRVDFNGAYETDEAIRVIRRMEPYQLEFAEQPVVREDLRGMAKVIEAVDTPISADDSVFTPDEALEVIRQKAADVINVYVMEAGGLTNCKKIAAIAEAAGIPCFVGACPMLSLEDVYGAHFAASTPNIRYACEFVGRVWHEQSELRNPMEIQDGMARVPDGPGLGVELDDEGIKTMRVVETG
jgi:L-alanine-DL-glutamate epimerase-like enolase superfamily enzyme